MMFDALVKMSDKFCDMKFPGYNDQLRSKSPFLILPFNRIIPLSLCSMRIIAASASATDNCCMLCQGLSGLKSLDIHFRSRRELRCYLSKTIQLL